MIMYTVFFLSNITLISEGFVYYPYDTDVALHVAGVVPHGVERTIRRE